MINYARYLNHHLENQHLLYRLGVDDVTILGYDVNPGGFWAEGHFNGTDNIWNDGSNMAPFDKTVGGGYFHNIKVFKKELFFSQNELGKMIIPLSLEK